jgi:hypothetical protein
MFSSLFNELIFNIPNLLLHMFKFKKKLVMSFQTYKVGFLLKLFDTWN